MSKLGRLDTAVGVSTVYSYRANLDPSPAKYEQDLLIWMISK